MHVPTSKQVRFHYGRIKRLRYKLQQALNAAHDAKVIEYKDYNTESPCKTLYETDTRIELTTKDNRALAMHNEIMKELKNE